MTPSATDLRVINAIRRGPISTLTISRECFTPPGKKPVKYTRPTAAHLKRMKQQGMIEKNGNGLWILTPATLEPSPSLF